ncbi:hypothetical protein WR25_08253 [Diploscapter pachys]|uniref:E3 ubiquitin ligase UBR4 C-terminal domain-containing protein n=1 Tax=Diploscapter pachys TaxID=2018661 RepID=A0A2A2LHJ5_9BILA|nr:hypothetical protein WR25_08253 [Diploscapter pachys]
MSGNPYKSTDAGMGPLMRDVKNRICRDTEMIALLEDDNGMELLVNNYIISLSLPVRQVYEKMWKKQHPGQAMVIVYRMRGLLGDAQETFISSFGETAEEEQMEDEKLNEALSCLVECGGLDVALQLLVKADRSTWGRQLLSQLRKLMDKCAKTRFGRTQLIERDGLSHFLKLLKGITKSEAEWLIKLVLNKELTEKAWTQQFSRGATELVELCLATLGSLILGNDEAEAALCSHCKLDADKLAEVDNDYSPQKEALQTELDRLATVAQAIPRSPAGCRLKDQILATGIVAKACKQIVDNHPPLYSATESPEWKAFVAKPSISLILKILHGLTKGHEPTQKAMADKNTLAILHRLEQVASENSIGTLAENVVEALKENEEVAAQIEKVREETKKKRKEMAMAMRMKQLSKLGMQVGKQGEVKVTSRKVVSEPLVDDVSDPLAVCCICRENLFTGKKAAAVYAFCSLTDSRIHYSVSQMVMVHIDCHSNAIKRGVGGRSVDEWAKAALHNAGVRCNMLTPLAIGNAPNAEWLTAVEKMRKNIEDALQIPPHFNRQFFYNDMCQIVDRFVFRRSFSEQAQGGGRESNVQYLAVLHLLCISFPPDDTSLTSNEPRHRLVSFLLTEQSLKSWEEQSQDILNASLRDGEDPAHPRNFADLKPLCLTWAFVDTYFKTVIPIPEDVERDEWLKARLLETLHKTAEFVKTFDEMILPIETWGEFIDYFNLPSDEFGDYFDQAPPPADDAQQI